MRHLSGNGLSRIFASDHVGDKLGRDVDSLFMRPAENDCLAALQRRHELAEHIGRDRTGIGSGRRQMRSISMLSSVSPCTRPRTTGRVLVISVSSPAGRKPLDQGPAESVIDTVPACARVHGVTRIGNAHGSESRASSRQDGWWCTLIENPRPPAKSSDKWES
jgi:hypothetical protein